VLLPDYRRTFLGELFSEVEPQMEVQRLVKLNLRIDKIVGT